MEIELEQGHHDLDDLLGEVCESLLEFPGVADEHLAGCGLLLESRGPDAETLLVAQRHKLPVRVALQGTHILVWKGNIGIVHACNLFSSFHFIFQKGFHFIFIFQISYSLYHSQNFAIYSIFSFLCIS